MDDDFLTFYHGGASADFSVSVIDIFYPAIKQQKKAGRYVGFYMFDENNKDDAIHYALNQKEETRHLLTIRMKKDVRIAKLPPFSITRITREQIEKFRQEGYDLIAGSMIGKMEYVLINKDKIIDMKVEKVTYDKQDKDSAQDSQSLSEDRYVTLEELEPLLSESGYFCLGHGTGRFGNGSSVVDAIFEKGLRAKDNSLYFTTIGLSTPTPEIKEQTKEFGMPEPTIDSLKASFNNWPHQNSKQIIIARIPIKYINMMGDTGDLDGERYGAFMRTRTSETGKVTNYLDPKFILGCFDVEKQMVRLNPHFEKQLSPETIAALSSKHIEMLEKTKDRVKRTMEASAFQNSSSQDFIVTDDTFDSSDWDSFETNSSGEESNQNGIRK